MKKLIITTLCALACMLMPAKMDAQGLGGLLKKTKNAVEKGTKIAESVLGEKAKTDQPSGERAIAAVTLNGIEVINPIQEFIDVEPVGLYGVSRTETKGDAYLVLKVRNKTRKESALIGSSINNKKMMAADNNGNVYNIDASGAMRYDTPEDMYVKIVMKEPQMMLMDVKKSLSVMPMIKIGVLLDAQHSGNLTFKNVPIYWDVEPED